jgi:hypothetical protein
VNVTTLTTTGDNGLLRGVRAALDGADEALLCVAFVQKAGVHLPRRQLEQLGSHARLLHTTTFTECSTALELAHELGAQVGIVECRRSALRPFPRKRRT